MPCSVYSYGGVFRVFYIQNLIKYKYDSFTSSISISMPFISFLCSIVLARTSSPMLNDSSESGHPCLVPDF